MAGGEIAGAIMGMAGSAFANQQQAQQQGRLSAQQLKYQMMLNQSNQKMAMDMWHKTNYQAQVQEMKKAGVSTGLMYGNGGAGGATTSGGQGGNINGGTASADYGAITNGAQAGAQIELMQAQRENIEANTNKTNIEASNIEEPTRVNIANTQANTKGTEIENEIKGDTREEEKQRIKAEANKATGEARSAMVKGDIDTETRPEVVMYIKGQQVSQALEQALTQARTGASLQEVANMKQAVRKMQAEVSQGWEKLSQTEREVQIKQFLSELKAIYPTLGEVWGGKMNEAIRDIDEALGQQGGNYHGQKRK